MKNLEFIHQISSWLQIDLLNKFKRIYLIWARNNTKLVLVLGPFVFVIINISECVKNITKIMPFMLCQIENIAEKKNLFYIFISLSIFTVCDVDCYIDSNRVARY